LLVLRCTGKLLASVGPPVVDPPPSTTVLGDWYAQPVTIQRRRFVLLISERSRLPVLLPGRDVKFLPRNFPDALALVLQRLQITPQAIDHEVEACRDSVVAATKSRSMLGTLNDFSHMLRHRLMAEPDSDLVDLALWLSDTPNCVFRRNRPSLSVEIDR